MTSRSLDEERVFHTARLLPTPEARVDYLDQVCAGDQMFRERVEALLAVHEREQSFLQSDVASQVETLDHQAGIERSGTSIGR